jgi:hypothetical protein
MKISRLFLALVIFAGLTFQIKSTVQVTNNTGQTLRIQEFNAKGGSLPGEVAPIFRDNTTREISNGGRIVLHDTKLTHADRS